jgi:hypothetical protein
MMSGRAKGYGWIIKSERQSVFDVGDYRVIGAQAQSPADLLSACQALSKETTHSSAEAMKSASC